MVDSATSPQSQLRPRSIVEQLIALSKSQQFYWFWGHFLTIWFSAMNFATSLFSASATYYRYCLLSILFTYVIVIKQIYFKNRAAISGLSAAKLVGDENVQYFLISLYFYLSSFWIGKLTGALFSFTIFSAFHILTYFQQNLLHYLPISLQLQQSLNSSINTLTLNHNQTALMVAANSEIFILVSVLIYSPLWLFRLFSAPFTVLIHLLTVAVLVVFLKVRFNASTFTQSIIKAYDYRVNAFLQQYPQLSSLGASYNRYKGALDRFLKPLDALTAKKVQ